MQIGDVRSRTFRCPQLSTFADLASAEISRCVSVSARSHIHLLKRPGANLWAGLNITRSIAVEVQETQKAWFRWNSQLPIWIHWCTCKSQLQCGSSATDCKFTSASAHLWEADAFLLQNRPVLFSNYVCSR